MKYFLSHIGERMSILSGVREIMADIEQTLKTVDPDKLINLSPGNPLILPETAKLWRKHAQKLLASEEFDHVIGRYGLTQGYQPFIDAIVEYFNKNYETNFTDRNILVTPGSQFAYFIAINAFAGPGADGNREVLFPLCPEYTGYSNMGIDHRFLRANKPNIEIIGDHRFKYKVNFENLSLDDTGLVLFSRPCNPSGNLVTDEEVYKLVDLAKAKNIPVMVDSAYAPPFPNMVFEDMDLIFDDNLIHVMSFSKTGLPGERLGVVIGSEENISLMRAFQANAAIHSSRFGQALLKEILPTGDLEVICDEIVSPFYENKHQLLHRLIEKYFNPEIPYYLHNSEGTLFAWIWFKDLPIADTELYQELKKENVLVVPGSSFFPGLKDKESWPHHRECIRISLTASDDHLDRGLAKIAEVVDKLYA